MKFALLNLCWFLGTAAAFRSKARQQRGIRRLLATSRSSIGHPLQHQPQEPHGGSNGRRSSSRGDRDLMISSTTSPCSDDLLRSLQLSDPSTTTNASMRITNCTETEIQWDEDGILTANLVRTVRVPSDLVLTTYKAYYNNGTNACQGFNGCVVPNGTEGFVIYPGQYEYDCSNVYCGPNAARECDGTYRDSPQCPANVTDEASLPDIPILRNVNCEAFSSFMIESDEEEVFFGLCGACQEDDQGLTTITCEPYCVGCNGNTTACITSHALFVFSEHQLIYVWCGTTTDGPVQCLTMRSPAQFDSSADPSLLSCELTVDGVACASCSVCGLGLGLDDLYKWANLTFQADCTNVDQVSKINFCDATGTGTGVFAPFFDSDFDPAMCPNETAALVPLIRAPPPIGTPITIVTQPQAPTAIPPVLPPTTAAPATSPSAPLATTKPVPPPVNNSSSSGTSSLVSSMGAVAIRMAGVFGWLLLLLCCSGG
jgi:hypothetical protein